jgi:hypothetical protein
MQAITAHYSSSHWLMRYRGAGRPAPCSFTLLAFGGSFGTSLIFWRCALLLSESRRQSRFSDDMMEQVRYHSSNRYPERNETRRRRRESDLIILVAIWVGYNDATNRTCSQPLVIVLAWHHRSFAANFHVSAGDTDGSDRVTAAISQKAVWDSSARAKTGGPNAARPSWGCGRKAVC